jgi:hypothetical protein
MMTNYGRMGSIVYTRFAVLREKFLKKMKKKLAVERN